MLKIKDDVKLEELEKFGFETSGGVYQLNLKIDYDRKPPLGWITLCIYIERDERIIRVSVDEEQEIDIVEIDVLYDLIQADLVEKIEEKR